MWKAIDFTDCTTATDFTPTWTAFFLLQMLQDMQRCNDMLQLPASDGLQDLAALTNCSKQRDRGISQEPNKVFEKNLLCWYTLKVSISQPPSDSTTQVLYGAKEREKNMSKCPQDGRKNSNKRGESAFPQNIHFVTNVETNFLMSFTSFHKRFYRWRVKDTTSFPFAFQHGDVLGRKRARRGLRGP